MSKVITFSRVFPAHHPKKGEPTHFVEKIWLSFLEMGFSEPVWFFDEYQGLGNVISGDIMNKVNPKYHTIRAGSRWEVGDKFSPRVWSGKPYASKMITIAPDIKIKKIWEIEIYPNPDILVKGVPILIFKIDGEEYRYGTNQTGELAKNDGLDIKDMRDWFNIHPKSNNQHFTGQIICWNDSINY